MADTKLGEGWDLVHAQDAETVVTSETQGNVQTIPASYRAEKQVNGTLVSAQGATMEALAAAAEYIDQTVATALSDPIAAPAIPVPDDAIETVVTDEGRFSGEQWTSEPDEETLAATAAATAEAENAITAEKAKDPTDQVVYDTADTVDSPGQSAGGTIIVPAGVTSLEEASQAQDAASHAAENERTADTQATAPTAETVEVNATEGAVEAADELGVDLASVEGTGKGGKVTKADVESHAANNG